MQEKTDTITVPRDLFEWLVDTAAGVKTELEWMGDRPYEACRQSYSELVNRVDQAVTLMGKQHGTEADARPDGHDEVG